MKASILIPKIVFEDESFLVLDKPAGMIVDKAGTVKEETVQDWLEKRRKTRKAHKNLKFGVFYRRQGIVHRLDKETSGLLVVAKTAAAFLDLQNQFKERKVEKKYLALVHGEVRPRSGEIKATISRSPFDRKKFGVFLGGRPARTKYKVRKNYSLGAKNYTLLELSPETGRTHQIRVHLKHLGHSVVADAKYAGRKTARADRQWCPRQFLHASHLAFSHPKTGKKVEFSSRLPVDLDKALALGLRK